MITGVNYSPTFHLRRNLGMVFRPTNDLYDYWSEGYWVDSRVGSRVGKVWQAGLAGRDHRVGRQD
jgi:hypothetical protein